MSTSSSLSSSFRLFTTKIPNSSLNPKTLSSFPQHPNFSSFPQHPNFSSFRRPITFQTIPTISSSLSPSPPSPLQPHDLPPKLLEIVNLFQSVPVPKAKYEQLLHYGKNLKPLEDKYKTKDNKVHGCVSQVWVRAFLDSDNNVVFEADSDALISKGLAALLVNGLSGEPVERVLGVRPDFAVHLGLQQSLSPGRNSGFLNMLKLMQRKAKELELSSEAGSEDVVDLGSKIDGGIESSNGNAEQLGAKSGSKMNGGVESVKVESSSEGNVAEVESVSNEEESNSGELGSRGKRIKEALERGLSPVELEVEDVSYQHAGHAGVRGSGDGETHFNVKAVSAEFEGKSMIKRHRLVYTLLNEELQSGLHALSIEAKTPAEVEAAMAS